jgi:hypothetical protein
MTTTLSSESKEMILSKLSGLFDLFQKCVAAIETSSNPIAKRKCASSLSSIQANYALVAENLSSKCYTIGVMLLGHYPCVSDESLAIVRKGFSEDVNHGAKLAALAKEVEVVKG